MMPGEGRFSDGGVGRLFGTGRTWAGTPGVFSGRADWNTGSWP